MSEIKKVLFVGAGNVATHLAEVLDAASLQIVGVFSRKKESAEILAQAYKAIFGDFDEIQDLQADLIILSVPDHAIQDVLSKIPTNQALLVHTSGSLDMQILQNKQQRIGVFYPLQTFSKSKKVDFLQIPLMVEARETEDLEALEKIAQKISEKVFRITSAQRKKIHIAAVFSSNFTNHLFHIAEELLTKENIPFEIIQPLIAETAEKIKNLRPFLAQTGPAAREDHETIEKHLKDLEDSPEYHEIYKLLSHHIIQSRKQ